MKCLAFKSCEVLMIGCHRRLKLKNPHLSGWKCAAADAK